MQPPAHFHRNPPGRGPLPDESHAIYGTGHEVDQKKLRERKKISRKAAKTQRKDKRQR
jgi:hypothetical protein